MSTTDTTTDRAVKRSASTTTVALLCAAGLLSGAALAAVSGNAKMQGQIGRGQFIAYWSPEVGLAAEIGIDMPEGTSDANAPISADKRTVTLPAGLELFDEQVAVTTNAAVGLAPKGTQPSKTGRAGYVSGFTGTIGKGWRLDLTTGGGAVVPAPVAGQSYNGVVPVTISITAVPDAAATDPLNLSNVGVVITEGTKPAGFTVAPLVGS